MKNISFGTTKFNENILQNKDIEPYQNFTGSYKKRFRALQ